jgi:hypothetical protein
MSMQREFGKKACAMSMHIAQVESLRHEHSMHREPRYKAYAIKHAERVWEESLHHKYAQIVRVESLSQEYAQRSGRKSAP